jgi:hypothetical protein
MSPEIRFALDDARQTLNHALELQNCLDRGGIDSIAMAPRQRQELSRFIAAYGNCFRVPLAFGQ